MFHAGRDIGFTSGDLPIADNGDIDMAGYSDSLLNAINFLLKTNKGEYKPDPDVGCDLGTLYGEPVDETSLDLIKEFIESEITKAHLYPDEFELEVLDLENNSVAILLAITATFLADDFEMSEENIQVAYDFPYFSGHPTEVYRN